MHCNRPRVVICGTYHRDHAALVRMFTELEASDCRLLAPFSVSFISTLPAVVRTVHDDGLTIADMETIHLRAIRDADFVMVHAPEGHIGISTAFELGYASARGKPLFSYDQPQDEMLSTRVMVVRSADEAINLWRQSTQPSARTWNALPRHASAAL